MEQTSFKREIVWSAGLFITVFFSANAIFSFGGNIINNLSVSNVATALEAVLPVEPTASVASETAPAPAEEKTVIKDIKLGFAGDIMFGRGVKNSVDKNFSGAYWQLFSKVKDQLKSYDVLFANLEGPVSDNGTDVGGVYSFRFEPKVSASLKDAGFGILSVANNHIFNWGEAAFADTLRTLSEAGIIYIGGGFTGSEAYQEKVVTINGVRIAVLAFSEFEAGGITGNSTKPGIAIISAKEVQTGVSRAKQNNDFVVVSYHFGEEYQNTPNEYQKKYAELAVDAGADLVIGHHPHVIQDLEQYKNSWIIYSLGNFIFDQDFSTQTMQGGFLDVTVNPETKKIKNVDLKKVSLNNLFQVESIE